MIKSGGVDVIRMETKAKISDTNITDEAYSSIYRVYVGDNMVYPSRDDLETPYRLVFSVRRRYKSPFYGGTLTTGSYVYTIEAADPIYVREEGPLIDHESSFHTYDILSRLYISLPFIGRGIAYNSPELPNNESYYPVSEKDTVFMTVTASAHETAEDWTEDYSGTGTWMFSPESYRCTRITGVSPAYKHYTYAETNNLVDERAHGFFNLKPLPLHTGHADFVFTENGQGYYWEDTGEHYLTHMFSYPTKNWMTADSMNYSHLPIAYFGRYYQPYSSLYNYAGEHMESFGIMSNNNPHFSSYGEWKDYLRSPH